MDDNIGLVDKAKTLVAERGGWDFIYSKYPSMKAAIDMVNKGQSQVPCPITGDGTTRYRLLPGWTKTGVGYHQDFARPHIDGIEMVRLLERFNSVTDALLHIIELCGGNEIQVSAAQVEAVRKMNKAASVKKLTPQQIRINKGTLKRVCKDLIPASSSIRVADYLRRRGLKGDMSKLPSNLRYHPCLNYFDDETEVTSYWPCLVARYVSMEGRLVNLHRHYIDRNGNKAQVDMPKKSCSPCGPTTGAAIRLDKPTYGVLGMCEGLETGLAIREATGLPVWPYGSAGMLGNAKIPKEFNIKLVIIFADRDKSGAGWTFAKKLAEALKQQGIRVLILLPPADVPKDSKSVDWEDMYRLENGDITFPVYVSDPRMAVRTGVSVRSEHDIVLRRGESETIYTYNSRNPRVAENKLATGGVLDTTDSSGAELFKNVTLGELDIFDTEGGELPYPIAFRDQRYAVTASIRIGGLSH